MNDTDLTDIFIEKEGETPGCVCFQRTRGKCLEELWPLPTL